MPQIDYTNNTNPNIYNNIGNILTNLDNMGNNQSNYEQNFDIVSSPLTNMAQQHPQQEQNLYKTANMYPKDHLRSLPPQQYNLPPQQQPPPPIYHQQVRENVSHHATPSPGYSSGAHMDNYDLSNSSSSQNHTITDISNTFLKSPITNSNNMQMDFFNTIGVPPRTHQQPTPHHTQTQQHPMHAQQQNQPLNQNNVNAEITSSSLADYMHHPYQYI